MQEKMKTKVLVLCTGNSCRSILAECLLNHYGKDKFQAFSAGSFPAGYVHPIAIRTLQNHHISTEGVRSKSWDEFKDQPFDLVITVCDNAAAESCPLFLGNCIKAHLGVEDPAKFTGSEEKIAAEFERVFLIIEKRIKALIALDFGNLSKENLVLELNKIAKLK